MSALDQLQLQFEVEQFLFRESRLIDNRELDEWLELWTMDCRYFVPVRHNKVPPIGEGLVAIGDELSQDHETAWIDDNKMLLFARVMRLRTGKAWSESPLSRTRRLIGNVEVTAPAKNVELEEGSEIHVISNMLQFRSRRQTEEVLFSCQRHDNLIKTADSFMIKQRTVILDSAVLNASFATFI